MKLKVILPVFVCLLMSSIGFSVFGDASNQEKTIRSWQWHGGDTWKPNGLDTTYRIENAFHGQAMVISNEQTVTSQFQGPVPGYQQRIKFESTDKDGEYKIYVKNEKGEKYYLTAVPGKKQKQVIEIQEINVFNKKGDNLITPEAKVSQESKLFNSDTYAPEKAIDKNESTFSHTNPSSHPWFELDLGKDNENISKITISIRSYLCQRLQNASVSIRNSNGEKVWDTVLKVKKPLFIIDIPKGVSGRYIHIEHDFTKDSTVLVYGTPQAQDKLSTWKIQLVKKIGYYTLENVELKKVIQAPKHMGIDVLAEASYPVQLVDYKKDDLTMMWTIEPVVDSAVDMLAASEIGWIPQAPQKWAFLGRKKKLDTLPKWIVTDKKSGKPLLEGQAVYAGSAYTLNYYIINLTPLKEEGDFNLDCDGDRTNIHIAKDAYVNFIHRGGEDVTHLSDILDGKGFIGYWAHNDLWNNVEYLTNPFFVIRDFATGKDKNTKIKITQKYLGGWDHTDRWSSAIQPISETLRQLVFTYDICEDKELKKHIVNEMKYGINYLLNIQNPDGSWPFATHVANKTTGTTAAVGGALIQSYSIIKKSDKKLAEKLLTASEKAWKWVMEHPKDWVNINMTYRHGWAEEKMMLALELYFVNNSEECKTTAFQMIKDSTIMQNKLIWAKKDGKFAGQAPDSRATVQALVTMMRHYKQLPEDIQKIVMEQWQMYYDGLLISQKQNMGPFRSWDSQISGYGPNSDWIRKANFFYRIYKLDQNKYRKGFYIAEHIMDWIFGVNPFATSQVYGFGDRFLSESWVRPYVKGSILPGLAIMYKKGKLAIPYELTPTLQGYGNGESETSAGVVMMQCLLSRQQLISIYPPAAPLPETPVSKPGQ